MSDTDTDTDPIPVTISDDGFSPRSFWAPPGQKITFSTSSRSSYTVSFKPGVFTNSDQNTEFGSFPVSSGGDYSVWVNANDVDGSHHTLSSTLTEGHLGTQTGTLNVGSGPVDE